MRKSTIFFILAGMMVCLCSQAQTDTHLQKLTKGLLQLRKAKASEKMLNETVINWSASGCPKLTLMDEIQRDEANEYRGNGANRFRMNQVVTYVYNRQNTGMVSKGDYFNSTEKNVYYSVIEKTVKKGCTATYTLTGHSGAQEFCFVSFNPKAIFTATVNGETATPSGEGVLYLKTKRIKAADQIVFSITNNSSANESFVVLNHNPQK
jgi:hypothetical protein